MAFTTGHKKIGGRQKGTPNKTTIVAKSAIEGCFEDIGGAEAFKLWAAQNPSDFYTKIYIKILPMHVDGEFKFTLADLLLRGRQ